MTWTLDSKVTLLIVLWVVDKIIVLGGMWLMVKKRPKINFTVGNGSNIHEIST